FLAAHDFEEHPVRFGASSSSSKAGEEGESGAVFADPTGALNLLAGVHEWELAELRMAARLTARDVGGGAEGSFARAFLSAALADVASKYDHVMRLEVDLSRFLAPRHGGGAGGAKQARRRLAELEFGHPVAAVQNRIATFLAAALERHARLVAVHPCADACFEDGARAMRRHVFFVGVVASAGAARAVDLGPSPDAQPAEAARFRAYWGERAELRRFRDGAIRLATVWGAADASPEQRAAVLPRMVAYLLRRHFAVRAVPEVLLADDLRAVDCARPASSVAAFGAATDPLAASLFCLAPRLAAFAQTTASADAAASFEAAVSAFDELQRELRLVEDQLPLRVLALHP
ncbi:U3 snoRNP protein, partial [Coemansia sp. RSA 2681]